MCSTSPHSSQCEVLLALTTGSGSSLTYPLESTMSSLACCIQCLGPPPSVSRPKAFSLTWSTSSKEIQTLLQIYLYTYVKASSLSFSGWTTAHQSSNCCWTNSLSKSESKRAILIASLAWSLKRHGLETVPKTSLTLTKNLTQRW